MIGGGVAGVNDERAAVGDGGAAGDIKVRPDERRRGGVGFSIGEADEDFQITARNPGDYIHINTDGNGNAVDNAKVSHSDNGAEPVRCGNLGGGLHVNAGSGFEALTK